MHGLEHLSMLSGNICRCLKGTSIGASMEYPQVTFVGAGMELKAGHFSNISSKIKYTPAANIR